MDASIFEKIRNGNGREKRAWADSLYTSLAEYISSGKISSNPYLSSELDSLSLKDKRRYVSDAIKALKTVNGYWAHAKRLADLSYNLPNDFQLLIDAKREGHADLRSIYSALTGKQYTPLLDGLFVPNVGVMGSWSDGEKRTIKNIFNASDQQHSPGHLFGKAIAGYDDQNVARHKPVYSRAGMMKFGDVLHVNFEGLEFSIVKLKDELPSMGLLLCLK